MQKLDAATLEEMVNIYEEEIFDNVAGEALPQALVAQAHADARPFLSSLTRRLKMYPISGFTGNLKV